MDPVIDWLRRAERWLDARGMPAWIVAMVAGLVLVWPVGLAILGYMIWSGRMGCMSRDRWGRRARPSGNHAFDDYRDETLRRLEEEQDAFRGFLDRLRRSKDRAEFERFMEERRGGGTGAEPA